MKEGHKKPYFVGIAVLILTAVLILGVFSLMRKPRPEIEYLADTQFHSCGWSYEVLRDGEAEHTEPEFLTEYQMVFSGSAPEACRITRILEENLPQAELELSPYEAGVELFLDDRILYSDFQNSLRGENGFLMLKEEEREGIPSDFRSIQISLPEDYTGKTLTIVTYFKNSGEQNMPVFPMLTSQDAEWALCATTSVWPVIVLTVCAGMALMLCLVLTLDLWNGNADYRILFLILFFVLLFLESAYNSMPGIYSMLSEHMNLSFLTELYIAPLCLYLAFCMKRKWKYVLAASTLICFVYEAAADFFAGWNVWQFVWLQDKQISFLLLLIMFAGLGAEYVGDLRKGEKQFCWYEWIIFSLVLLLSVLYFAEEWDGQVPVYLRQLAVSMSVGNFAGVVRLLSSVASFMAALMLLVNFVRRTLENRIMLGVLEERNHYALESYERMVSAEEATNAVRHEMRHHMIVLKGFFEGKDTERAISYLNGLEMELDQLPVMRYCNNMLVNMVAGSYLDRAKKQGIEVQHQLMVPEHLAVEAEDLCVFLSNMLENALNACEKLPPEQERFIKVVMHIEGNFLYIGCTNSMPGRQEEGKGRTEPREHRMHGYGLAAMSRIAEKYGSILKIDEGEGLYSIKTNFYLKKSFV